MTVAATTNRKTYTGDNVTTSFATSPVIFYATSDLQVRVTVIATGVSTLLTLNTHYTVSGGSSAGTVSLAGGSSPHGALLSTEKLVILRVLPLTQGVDLVNNNNSDAEVLEAALDKLTDVDQQLSERQDRALTFPEGDVSGSTTTLQDASVRAGRLLGFDALGVLTTFVVSVGTSLVDLAAAGGSALIGFIQAGTGALLRSVQSKLRDQVSVFDFMNAAQIADVQAGTLLIDVTAAIAAADAAACSGVLGLDGSTVLSQAKVRFPAGKYRHTGLTFRGAPWVGDGMNNTFLEYYGAGAGVDATGTNTNRKFLNISEMTLGGSHFTANTAYGLKLGYNQRSLRALSQVRIDAFPSWGILFDQDSWQMSFYDVYVKGCASVSNAGIGITPAVVTLADIDWFNLQVEGCGQAGSGTGGGLELNDPAVNKWTFHGGLIQGNKGAAEARFIDGDSVKLEGVYVEADLAAAGAVDGLIFGGSVNASLDTCRISAVATHSGKAVRFIGTSKGSINNLWVNTGNWPVAIAVEDTAIVQMLSEGNLGTLNTVVDGAALIRSTPKAVTLTDAATIAVNAALGTHFEVTLAGNRTMGVPTNPSVGQKITFTIVQDGPGARTLAFTAPNYKTTWVNTGNVSGAQQIISFTYLNTRWKQDAGQPGYY